LGNYIGVLNYQGVSVGEGVGVGVSVGAGEGVGVSVVLIKVRRGERRMEVGFMGQKGRDLSEDSGIKYYIQLAN
jgi:hypothetical protein